MSRRYFGTDGIRGRANRLPMTADVAMRVGMAVGMSFKRGSHRVMVLARPTIIHAAPMDRLISVVEIDSVRGRYTTSQCTDRKSNLPRQSSPMTKIDAP